MNLSLMYFPISVQDIDLSIAFYRDVLGLELRNDVAKGDFRWVTLSPTSQPELEIVLSEPHAGRSEEDGDMILALLVKGSFGPFVFSTDDLDAAFEKIQASGADVVQEPMDQGWGKRDCAVRDPSGNMIRVAQAVS